MKKRAAIDISLSTVVLGLLTIAFIIGSLAWYGKTYGFINKETDKVRDMIPDPRCSISLNPDAEGGIDKDHDGYYDGVIVYEGKKIKCDAEAG